MDRHSDPHSMTVGGGNAHHMLFANCQRKPKKKKKKAFILQDENACSHRE